MRRRRRLKQGREWRGRGGEGKGGSIKHFPAVASFSAQQLTNKVSSLVNSSPAASSKINKYVFLNNIALYLYCRFNTHDIHIYVVYQKVSFSFSLNE